MTLVVNNLPTMQLVVKNLPTMQEFNPWVENIPGVENGNLLQYSCLESSIDRGAWWATVRGAADF